MGYGKAVEEVWTWRDALAKELEKIPREKRADCINQKASDLCRQYGLKCCPANKTMHTPDHDCARVIGCHRQPPRVGIRDGITNTMQTSTHRYRVIVNG